MSAPQPEAPDPLIALGFRQLETLDELRRIGLGLARRLDERDAEELRLARDQRPSFQFRSPPPSAAGAAAQAFAALSRAIRLTLILEGRIALQLKGLYAGRPPAASSPWRDEAPATRTDRPAGEPAGSPRRAGADADPRRGPETGIPRDAPERPRERERVEAAETLAGRTFDDVTAEIRARLAAAGIAAAPIAAAAGPTAGAGSARAAQPLAKPSTPRNTRPGIPAAATPGRARPSPNAAARTPARLREPAPP